MKTPSEFYQESGRDYPRHLLEPDYSDNWEVRRVRECGRIRWCNVPVFVSKVLTGEPIGLEPVDDGQWRVWFFDYPLGLFDERKGTVRRLATNPQPQPEIASGSKEI